MNFSKSKTKIESAETGLVDQYIEGATSSALQHEQAGIGDLFIELSPLIIVVLFIILKKGK